MATRKGPSIPIEDIDSLLMVPEVQENGGYTEVDVLALVEFKNHPFKVLDDERMDELVDSIKERGIMTPIIVRPEHRDYGSKYEIISGHRRVHAAKRIGIRMIPAIVKDVDDDQATIMMVDANVQRELVLPSEKAFALKMKLDAIKHQGVKRNITSTHDGGKSVRTPEASDLVGKDEGISGTSVQRYVRLTYLIPAFLSLVDAKKLSIASAVELSYFSEKVQTWLAVYIRSKGILKPEQLVELRQYRDDRTLTEEKLYELLDKARATPAPKRKVVIYGNRLDKYFPAYLSQTEIERIIFKLLDNWKKKNG